MNIIDLIEEKKQGKAHSKDEIFYIIKSYIKGSVSEAQITAWLMAVCFKGLNIKETAWLTEALANSGTIIDFAEVGKSVLDKHSTGGVGDKVTITLIPLLAAAGVPVAKLADRGYCYAAGTIDKLESIPNLKTNLSLSKVVEQVKSVHAVIASPTEELAPAEKKLYELRNKTATYDSDVLIASSIISKKIASGAHNILLDIKYGSGASMKTPEDAEHLARIMVKVGKLLGKSIVAVVTSMEEPLGRAIGNSLEVIEAIEFLKGNIETGDLAELTYYFATEALLYLKLAETKVDAEALLKNLVHTGKALEKFKELIAIQGGDIEILENYDKFELPLFKIECESKKQGYVHNINAHNILLAVKALGANIDSYSNPIDLSTGVYLNKKSGEYVNKGEILYTIYSNDEYKTQLAQKYCDEAFSIRENKSCANSLIYSTIGTENEEENV